MKGEEQADLETIKVLKDLIATFEEYDRLDMIRRGFTEADR